MAFSDFTYPDVLTQLGLTERGGADLFAGVKPVPPGDALRLSLPHTARLGALAHSEASRSTWMVGPVLADLWTRYAGRISVFAGVELAADPDAQLTGFCDFLIGRGPQVPRVVAPVVAVVEAKRDSIPGGLGQCIAAMVGVQRFNRRAGDPIDPVYGCVTTGSLWKFLKLSGTTVTPDVAEYTIAEVDRLLGILISIVEPVPAAA